MLVRSTINKHLKKFSAPYETFNWVEVSQSALLHNVELYEKLSGRPVIPVLKGNAYGHGINIVAKALKDKKLPYIAVDGYFEALRVREVSKQPVLVMGMIKPENFKHMKYHSFAFVVHDLATIDALGKTGRPVKIHLEINTGMNRYGIQNKQIPSFLERIKSYPKLELEGLMSHLADADGEDMATVQPAVEAFDDAVDMVRAAGFNPRWLHLSQSAGALRANSKYANAVRIGLGTYGVNPFPRDNLYHQRLKDLHPALKLVSTISEVHSLQKGDKVSYNYTFTAPKAMRIGVLPLGFYEGINRALSNRGTVKVGKKFAPIVGLVCMNHTIISLEGALAQVGDEVTVISDKPEDHNSVFRMAEELGGMHTSYSLLTALSPDVRRRLVL